MSLLISAGRQGSKVKHIHVFGFTIVSFLVSPLIFSMEPEVQTHIMKQEASNRVFLTIMSYHSELKADGSQHIITNIDCYFME